MWGLDTFLDVVLVDTRQHFEHTFKGCTLHEL